MAKALAVQTGYAFDNLTEDTAKDLFANQAGMALIMLRREELRTFTAQLEVRAAADALPAVRLPAGVNKARDISARLAAAARRRRSANQERRVNRFAMQLSESLSAAVPSSLLTIVKEAGDRVKLIADTPLEWMKVGSTPLMLRADCSRIPATPGNSSFAFSIGGLERIIPLSAFAEVLVIRSYSSSDPIRNTLVGTVREFLTRAKASIRVRVVDVKTLDEMGAALSEFNGALFIFDGHGGPGSPTSPGTLEIGGSNVDLWPLRAKVRIPPIAILSACDTHAFDGSHGTSAHALLAAGAETVVSTTLPVDAAYSAMFVARLLYRIHEFLPQLLSGPHGIARWSQVLPGLQRMVYTTEMLRAIDRKYGIRLSDDDHLRAGFIANMHINGGKSVSWEKYPDNAELPPRTKDLFSTAAREEAAVAKRMYALADSDFPDFPVWLDAVLNRVAKDTAVSRSTINKAVREWAWVTDALKYLQLGNPERLLVVRDNNALSWEGSS